MIAPEPGVTGISVGVFDSPQEVTAENIDGLMGELRTGAETFLAQNVEGSKLDGDVEQVTIAGLPAVDLLGDDDRGPRDPHARGVDLRRDDLLRGQLLVGHGQRGLGRPGL